MNDASRRLPHDWYASPLPPNVEIGNDVYLDSAYAFAPFLSRAEPGLRLGQGSGAYDRTTFAILPGGQVTVGDYTCLNGAYLVCAERITIGAHCFLAWGVVLTDCWPRHDVSRAERARVLQHIARDPTRPLPHTTRSYPVVLEENVWVGFDAVILPGVTIGRGSVIGCKSVVSSHVPPYTVAVGNPARAVRSLSPDDTDDMRERALREFIKT